MSQLWDTSLDTENFDPTAYQKWTQQYWWISGVASLAYLTFLYSTQRYMTDKKPFGLEKPLVLWNVCLAVFSALGTVSVYPDFYDSLKTNGFTGSICLPGNYFQGTTGFWFLLFTWSKLIEMGDTVFLVLRKRPLTLLHVYHHVVTLLYLFYCYNHNPTCMRWVMFLNLLVHSVMYSYFALQALSKVLENSLGYKAFLIPRWVAVVITLIQIAQMVIDCCICVALFFIVVFGSSSDGNRDCQYEQMTIYYHLWTFFTFLLLFVQFFCRSYLSNGSVKQKGT